MTDIQSAESDAIVQVFTEHAKAAWREVRPATAPGAKDERYGLFCACGHMFDASEIEESKRRHLAELLIADGWRHHPWLSDALSTPPGKEASDA